MAKLNITWNISLTGTGIFSFLGGVMPAVFRFFENYVLAEKIERLFSPIPNVLLTPAYIWLFTLCVTALVFINWRYLIEMYRSVKKHFTRTPNTYFMDAISYIKGESFYGDHLNNKHASIEAFCAIENMARKGKITIFGKLIDSNEVGAAFQLIPIKKRELKNLEFIATFDKSDGKLHEVEITKKDDRNILVYTGLYMDKKDLHREWPPHKRNKSFY